MRKRHHVIICIIIAYNIRKSQDLDLVVVAGQRARDASHAEAHKLPTERITQQAECQGMKWELSIVLFV